MRHHRNVRFRTLIGTLTATTIAAAWLIACGNSSFSANESDASIDDAATSDGQADSAVIADAGPADATVADGGACVGVHGTYMVSVPTTGQPYCIDATEATRADYATFVQAIADRTYTPSNDPRCAWNQVFPVDPSCEATTTGDAGGAGADQLPVTCINWCDAFSYCDWAGKRLCGTIGSTQELDPLSRSIDPNVSQWENACTANHTLLYPYGDTFESNACNVVGTMDGGATPGTGLALPGAYSECNGGYHGITDMAGNASEWVDACNEVDGGAALTFCVRIGGSYEVADQLPAGQCIAYASNARQAVARDVGFRCCSK